MNSPNWASDRYSMNRLDAAVKSALAPVRDAYLAHMFRQLRVQRASGHQIVTEVVARDERGVVMRDGVLNLPRRTDFVHETAMGPVRNNTHGTARVEFEPLRLALEKGAHLSISPLEWNKVQLSFEADDDTKRLVRLRLWFLEWFQARHSESSDDLSGVVHSIDGPRKVGNLWFVSIDMGSAPTDAFVELVHVLASRGVKNIAFGSELDQVPNEF